MEEFLIPYGSELNPSYIYHGLPKFTNQHGHACWSPWLSFLIKTFDLDVRIMTY